MEFDKHNELHNQINVSTLTLVSDVPALWATQHGGRGVYKDGKSSYTVPGQNWKIFKNAPRHVPGGDSPGPGNLHTVGSLCH